MARGRLSVYKKRKIVEGDLVDFDRFRAFYVECGFQPISAFEFGRRLGRFHMGIVKHSAEAILDRLEDNGFVREVSKGKGLMKWEPTKIYD